MPSLSVKQGAALAERDRPQSGQPVATASVAEEDWELVADELAAAAGENGRSAAETRPVLLAAAGPEPPDAATLRGHGRADRVAALARGVESATGRRKPGEASGGMAKCPGNRMRNASKCRLTPSRRRTHGCQM